MNTIKKLFLLGLLTAAPCVAEVVPDSVPFELGADRRVYVTCQVGTDARRLRLLLDTGATDVVLNTASPRTVGLVRFDAQVSNRGANSEERVAATAPEVSLRLGPLRADSLRVLGIAYPPDAWDGVLGLTFLRRYGLRIDYVRRMLYFYPPRAAAVPPGSVALPLEWRLGVPVVRLSLTFCGQPHDVAVEVDTGSDRVLDLNTPFVNRHGLMGQQRPFAQSAISGTVHTGGVLHNVFFDVLRLGPYALPLIPGALSQVEQGVQATEAFDGVVGSNLLFRFQATYDFAGGCLYLAPNPYLYVPFYDFLQPAAAR